VDSARANLAATFVNAFVNAGFGQDKLVTAASEDEKVGRAAGERAVCGCDGAEVLLVCVCVSGKVGGGCTRAARSVNI
jgi:hypothetical protein